MRLQVYVKFARTAIKTLVWTFHLLLYCDSLHKSWCSFFDLYIPTLKGRFGSLKYPHFLQRYFCGVSAECRSFASFWALDEAKRNVDKYFTVVGIRERFDETLKLFERKFSGPLKGLASYSGRWWLTLTAIIILIFNPTVFRVYR